jgi:hypothetical protein
MMIGETIRTVINMEIPRNSFSAASDRESSTSFLKFGDIYESILTVWKRKNFDSLKRKILTVWKRKF